MLWTNKNKEKNIENKKFKKIVYIKLKYYIVVEEFIADTSMIYILGIYLYHFQNSIVFLLVCIL